MEKEGEKGEGKKGKGAKGNRKADPQYPFSQHSTSDSLTFTENRDQLAACHRCGYPVGCYITGFLLEMENETAPSFFLCKQQVQKTHTDKEGKKPNSIV